MKTTKNYKGIKVNVEIGTEGPSQDPYSFDRYTLTIKRWWGLKEVTIHLGLGEYIKVNDKEVANDYKDMEKPFKKATGLDLGEFLNAMQAPETYVCKCGCDRILTKQGFPGETFDVCEDCGRILHAEVNINDVM